MEHSFTAYSITQIGRIKWPQWDVLAPGDWDIKSLKHFKEHWEQQLKNKRNRGVADRLKRCIALAQAELMRRVMVS